MYISRKVGLIKIACILFLFPCVLSFVGCSVYKAASNEGLSVGDVSKCETKGCFLSKGMDKIESRDEKKGKYVEVYRSKARKSGANYARAAGHGLLDVVTLGLWEVAGTPVEGAISNNRGYILVVATYPSKTAENADKIDIYNAKGKMVSSRNRGKK